MSPARRHDTRGASGRYRDRRYRGLQIQEVVDERCRHFRRAAAEPHDRKAVPPLSCEWAVRVLTQLGKFTNTDRCLKRIIFRIKFLRTHRRIIAGTDVSRRSRTMPK